VGRGHGRVRDRGGPIGKTVISVGGVTSYVCSLSDAVLELAQSSSYLYNPECANVFASDELNELVAPA
jgi:hypothetical protein